MNRRRRSVSIYAKTEQEFLNVSKFIIIKRLDVIENHHTKTRIRRKTITGSLVGEFRHEFIEFNEKSLDDTEKNDIYENIKMNTASSINDSPHGSNHNSEYCNEDIEWLEKLSCDQYSTDNDHMLGTECHLLYKSNIVLQKTEEEDSNELENLIIKLNKMNKTELDESNTDDYNEIVCRYFKANIQYSLSKQNEHKKLESNFPIHNIIRSCYAEKIRNNQLDISDQSCSLRLKKSLSFNSISEVNFKSFVSCVLSTSQRSSKEDRINSHIVTKMEEGFIKKDNIKEIINENIEANELLKVLLIGDKNSRENFLKGIRNEIINFGETTINVEPETIGT